MMRKLLKMKKMRIIDWMRRGAELEREKTERTTLRDTRNTPIKRDKENLHIHAIAKKTATNRK